MWSYKMKHFHSRFDQLTYWGRDKMAVVSQTILSNAFSWMKMHEWISLKISLKLVPKGPINNIPALVQVMAWRRPGEKPLTEPMVVKLQTLGLNELITNHYHQVLNGCPQWTQITASKGTVTLNITKPHIAHSVGISPQKIYSKYFTNICKYAVKFINDLASTTVDIRMSYYTAWWEFR